MNVIKYRIMQFEVTESADHHVLMEQQILEQVNAEEAKKKPQQRYIPPLKMKMMVAYLYFIQGVVLVLPATMTLVYPKLPPYTVLSIFSASNLPFSTKFIIAPFIQKFTSIRYGKRKTWIIISQLTTSSLLLIASFFTDQQYEVFMGVMMVLSVFFIALQDISLDALAIKELKIPNLVGMLQAIMSTLGVIFGSVFLLKSTSLQFARSINLQEPIAHPSSILKMLGFFVMIPSVIIHFSYDETKLKSEKIIMKKKFCDIVSVYKKFFDFKSRFSLTFFLLLLYIHGFTYIQAGYQYELIKAGFVKNTLNTITNISLVPISIAAYILSQKIDAKSDGNLLGLLMVFLCTKWVLFSGVYVIFPTNVPSVSFIYFSLQALEMMKYLLISIFVNNFPVTGISGMTLTMMVSGHNFGNQKSFSMLLTGYFGWTTVAIFGLFVQFIAISVFPHFFRKAQTAELDLGIQINENSSQQEGDMVNNQGIGQGQPTSSTLISDNESSNDNNSLPSDSQMDNQLDGGKQNMGKMQDEQTAISLKENNVRNLCILNQKTGLIRI